MAAAYLVTLIGVLSAPVAAMTTDKLLSGFESALASKQCIEVRYQVFSRALGLPQGSALTDLSYEYLWRIDRDSGKERLTGKRRFKIEQRVDYQPVDFAFDGHELRSLDLRSLSGMIRENSTIDSVFFVTATPAMFLGMRAISGDLLGILRKSAGEPIDLGSGVYRLEATTKLPGLASDYIIAIEIDTTKDYLPRSIRVIRKSTNTTSSLIEIDKFLNLPEIGWFPIEGHWANYAVMSRTPPDYAKNMTATEFKKLSEAERQKIRNDSTYVTQELGDGMHRIVLDPTTIKVNHEFPPDSFTFEFPKGSLVWDDFKQKSYRVGGSQIQTTDTESRFGLGSVLIGINIVVLFLVGIWIFRKWQVLRLN